jgi:hypothetical protein
VLSVRKPASAFTPAKKATGPSDAPVELVCLALVLALVALALRIAAIW